VSELSATGTADTGGLPEVLHAVWRWLDDFGRLGSAERTTAIFKNFDAHNLTWQDVRNEDDPTLVAGDENATVGNLFDGCFKFAA
jgi:hypothetical protein